jgi:hypothetical protein
MTKLTLKQQRFVNAYTRSGNGRLAAKEAGYNGNDHTLEQIASENLRKPEVTAAIALAFQPEQDLAERVVSELKLLAFTTTDEPMSQANKIRSLELLAKVLQMFKDASVNVNINDSYRPKHHDLREMTETELCAELERIEKRKEEEQMNSIQSDGEVSSAVEIAKTEIKTEHE